MLPLPKRENTFTFKNVPHTVCYLGGWGGGWSLTHGIIALGLTTVLSITF